MSLCKFFDQTAFITASKTLQKSEDLAVIKQKYMMVTYASATRSIKENPCDRSRCKLYFSSPPLADLPLALAFSRYFEIESLLTG